MAANRSGRRRGRSALRWRVSTLVRRHLLHSDGFVLLMLSLCAAALGVLNTRSDRTWFPVASLSLSVLVGGFLLTVRSLLLLYVVVVAVGVFESSHGGRSAGRSSS